MHKKTINLCIFYLIICLKYFKDYALINYYLTKKS